MAFFFNLFAATKIKNLIKDEQFFLIKIFKKKNKAKIMLTSIKVNFKNFKNKNNK